MDLRLAKKIDKRISLPLKIRFTPHSEATPYHSTQYYNQELHRGTFSPPHVLKDWVR
jgi:hypothetical protein